MLLTPNRFGGARTWLRSSITVLSLVGLHADGVGDEFGRQSSAQGALAHVGKWDHAHSPAVVSDIVGLLRREERTVAALSATLACFAPFTILLHIY